MTAKPSYSSAQLAFVVPTKDRPEKLRKLLQSLAAQTEPCGRVVIVDGSNSAGPVAAEFGDRLPLDYVECRPAGQIRQRNLGIGMVDERTPLVGSLDDDIVLEPAAVEEMVRFWNRCEAETAAVSFNITNEGREPRSFWRRVFLLTASEQGRVLKSGATTSNNNVPGDLNAQWVCGGATVWRLEVLRQHPHRSIAGQWAIGEDIIYSYPLGKRYPLYVCAAARVRHEHVFDYKTTSPHRFHGYTRTLWMFYFVASNADLSRLAFLWMTLGSISGRLLVGLFTGQRTHLEFAAGQVLALGQGLRVLARGEDLGEAIGRLGVERAPAGRSGS